MGPGFFSVFGMARRDREWLAGFFSERLGVSPAFITYPDGSTCFYYTNHGEIRETAGSVYLGVGFLRSPDGAPLVVGPDIERKLSPEDFESGSISGNGHLVRFHRLEPQITIFMTFMATSQVYYMRWEGGIACSTDLRVLLRISDEIRVNEKAVPLHFVYRIVPGPMTYFKDVFRVFPGETACWRRGGLEIRRSRDAYSPTEKPAYDHLDSAVCEEYFGRLSGIMSLYVRQIGGGKIANELSGGVDSTVVQLLIRQASGKETPPTFSYAWEADSFKFEVEYARMASELLGTRHTFLPVQNKAYADLLVRTIETLAQPNIFVENVPGQLALAEYMAAEHPELHYVFMGMGADALHGIEFASRVAGLDRYKNIPGHYAFREIGRLLGDPIRQKGPKGTSDVLKYLFMRDTYRCLRPPANLLDPVKRAGIPYTSFETIRRFMGDQVLLDALDHTRRLAEETMTAHNPVERVQDIDTVTLAYEPAVVCQTLFSASGKDLIPFYFDQEVIRLVKSVAPEVRYMKDGEVKPILKSILRHRSLGRIVHQRKGASGFYVDLRSWMMSGFLREMVHSIERPGFLSQRDFQTLLDNRYPYGYDLVWPLLTFDIFRKHVARRH